MLSHCWSLENYFVNSFVPNHGASAKLTADGFIKAHVATVPSTANELYHLRAEFDTLYFSNQINFKSDSIYKYSSFKV